MARTLLFGFGQFGRHCPSCLRGALLRGGFYPLTDVDAPGRQ